MFVMWAGLENVDQERCELWRDSRQTKPLILAEELQHIYQLKKWSNEKVFLIIFDYVKVK
jgi:hypothetical protein